MLVDLRDVEETAVRENEDGISAQVAVYDLCRGRQANFSCTNRHDVQLSFQRCIRFKLHSRD